MVQKSETLIEKFPNGITIRWNDVASRIAPDKALAIKGEEANCIGNSVWESVYDLLEQAENGKVEVLVEVRTL